MSYGHALKTIGRRADAVAAYQHALTQAPQLGEAWWSLANLKTHRFEAADIAAMNTQLARGDLSEEDRLHLDFALAKALEDKGDFAGAFAEYAKGNAIRHAPAALCPPTTSAIRSSGPGACSTPTSSPRGAAAAVRRAIRSSSSACRARARPWSSRSWPAIPQVEGTMELPDMLAIVQRLDGAPGSKDRGVYPESVGRSFTGRADGAGRGLPDAHPRSPPHRSAAVHRQAAEQLAARRPDPADPAQRHASSTRGATRWAAASPASSSTSPAARPSPTTSPTSAATTATTWR